MSTTGGMITTLHPLGVRNSPFRDASLPRKGTSSREWFPIGLVLLAIAVLAGTPARAQFSTTTIAVGENPKAVAVNSVTNKIYVCNSGSNNVTVIDGATLATTTVAVGTAPTDIAVNPVTNKIYVVNNGSGNLTVIDGVTNAAITVTDPNAVNAGGLAVDPVTNRIYVANAGDDDYSPSNSSITAIDGATNRTTTVAVDGGLYSQIIANTATNKFYLFSVYPHDFSSAFTVLDGSTNTNTVGGSFGGYIWAVALNPVTSKIYVGGDFGQGVNVIDEATNAITTITIGAGRYPVGIAVNSVINKIYISSGNVTVIDGATNSTATVTDPNAEYPGAVAVNPVTNKVYVANDGSNNVTVIDGATNGTTTVTDPNAISPGAIAVNSVTNKAYVINARSNNVTVIESATPGVPSFTTEPASQVVPLGAPLALSAMASGTSVPTYQWRFNDVPILDGDGILGSTTSTLYLGAGAKVENTGVYSCVATNSAGAASSGAVALSVVATSTPGRLINISSRAFVGTGSEVMIAGFVISGEGSKALVLRGVGPTLASFGVSGTLPNPVLFLYDGANPPNLVANDSGWQNPPTVPTGPWGGEATPVDATAADFAQVGAFGLVPDSNDSAIKIRLPAGAYSTQISNAFTSMSAGTTTGTGVVLAEVYDADTGIPAAQIVNLSSRAFVGTGSNILIAGFVIAGSTSQTVLIRASGPALEAFGVSGTIPDPQLLLFDSNQNLVASDSGWGGSLQIAAAASAAGAFAWKVPSSDDSAVLITLPPGNYTAQVSGASGDTGVALVEIYALP